MGGHIDTTQLVREGSAPLLEAISAARTAPGQPGELTWIVEDGEVIGALAPVARRRYTQDMASAFLECAWCGRPTTAAGHVGAPCDSNAARIRWGRPPANLDGQA